MLQYVTRPRAALIDDPDWGVAATSGEIFVDDGLTPTGLLDAEGRRLYRQRRRIRLGFKEEN